MYADSRVAERLEIARQEFQFPLDYKSVEEVVAFESRLIREGKYLYNDTGRPESVKNLSTADAQWIHNEQILVQCDAAYALTRYAFIKNEQNIIERFTFRVPQRILFDLISDLEHSRRTLEIMILKARQLGCSTIVELLISLRIIFSYGVNAVIGSADRTKTALMANMLFLCYDMMPVWLRPQWTRRVESDQGMLVFGQNMTGVSFQHGAQMSGIARGSTPTVYHLSEVASFVNALDQIESSLFRCVHPSPNVFGVLESSGEGDKGWWPDTWRVSKERWPQGKSRLCPLFLPWFCGIEMYPDHQWITYDHPVPSNWSANKDTREHVAKCELYVASQPLLEKHLIEDRRRRTGIVLRRWTMPREQQWFWEFGHEEAKAKGTEAKWYQEMCLTGDMRMSTEEGIIRMDAAHNATICESGIITAHLSQGLRPIWELNTMDGRILRGTIDHPVKLVGGDWRNLGDLKAGDKIKLLPPMFAKNIEVVTWDWLPACRMSVNITPRFAKLLGYFMGDGMFYAGTFEVSVDAQDTDIVPDVQSLFQEFLGREAAVQKQGKMYRLRAHSVRWLEMLKALGCVEPAFHKNLDRNCGWKRKVCVPECIFRSPKEIIKEFLSAVFECDGHAYKDSPRIVLWSRYDEFLRDIQLLLLGFGIRSRFASLEIKKMNGKTYTGRSLQIQAAHANKFYDDIGFISERKRTTGKRRTHNDKRGSRFLELEDTVLSVTDLHRSEPVYDITVADSHKFSANGIEVHNCADDEEALQRSTESVFGFDTIAQIDARRATNYKVYGLSGQSIESAHEPRVEDIDYQQDRIPVRYTSPRGESFRWELLPMKVGGAYPPLDERDPTCCMGYLIVWHPPRAGVNYAIGVDTSEGRGKDSTVISVWALGWGKQPDVQVAEFASAYVSHVEAFSFVLAIAAYYKSEMQIGVTRWKEPYVSIEQVAAVGDTCQLQMRKMGYSNFHVMSRYDDKSPSKRRSRKSGWFTFGWSRPVLLGNFTHWAKNGWAEINSPWLIEEMRHFEVHVTKTGKERMEHESDEHDDRIFAAAMGVFPPHDLEPMAERSARRIDDADSLPPIDLGQYRGHVISATAMNEKRIVTLDDVLYSESRLERLSR